MREEGHGERIFSGSGAHSVRWHFPLEILERAVEAAQSSHARLKLYADAGLK